MINKTKPFVFLKKWLGGYIKTINAGDDNLCRAFKKDSTQDSHPFGSW